MRRLAASVGMLAFVLLVCLAAAEGFLRYRAAQTRDAIASRLETQELCTTAHPELVYTYLPNECGMNSHGYPDDEPVMPKPEGVFRILLIGDSVAEGVGVAREDRFADLVEDGLNGTAPVPVEDGLNGTAPVPVEIVVLARRGYSMSQELYILEHEASAYEPDLILWSYVLNDPGHPVYDNFNGQLGEYYVRPASYLIHRVQEAWFRLRERGASARIDLPDDMDVHVRIHQTREAQVDRQFARLGALRARLGVPMVLLIHPVFEEGGSFDSYSLASLHSDLAERAREQGLVVHDLLESHRGYSADDLRVVSEGWFDPWHPNELGHRVTAEAVEGFLVERGLVPPE